MVETDSINVLIVDDSAVIRGQFGQTLEKEPDITVVTTAQDGAQALKALECNEIDVVLLDLQMPVMDGVTALGHIVKDHPGVKVIIASSLSAPGADVTLKCLDMGAVDFLTKPSTRSLGTSAESVKRDLVNKVRAVGRGPKPSVTPTTSSASNSFQLRTPLTVSHVPRCLVIGSSTGGPNALSAFFNSLSRDISVPIAVAQHMPPVFTEMLASRIAKQSQWNCTEAKDGDILERGKVLIAPGDYHMTLVTEGDKVIVKLNQEPPEHFCRPSVNPLFRSAAKVYGEDVLAIVFTGMGEDGLEGSKEIVDKGGKVIAQDEATSVVWGMPGAVTKAGYASAVLPLEGISKEVEKLCGKA